MIMLYGTSNQGKTHTIRNLIRHWSKRDDTVVMYLKNTRERADVALTKLGLGKRLLFSKYNERTMGMINDIIKQKKRHIEGSLNGKGSERLKGEPHPDTKYIIIFDDIQGTVKDTAALNLLLSKLAKSGRHSDITAVLSVQAYKSIAKSTRSQSTLFCAMWPLDDEYKRLVYSEFFNIRSGYPKFNDLKLPQYSMLMKEKSTGKRTIWLSKGEVISKAALTKTIEGKKEVVAKTPKVKTAKKVKERTGPQQKKKIKKRIVKLKGKKEGLKKELKKLRAERARDIELYGKARSRPLPRRRRMPPFLKKKLEAKKPETKELKMVSVEGVDVPPLEKKKKEAKVEP
jgi:hypothetical protein